MCKRQRKRFDHGEPIAKIDTRPLAFVAMFLAVFALVHVKTPQHALIIDLVSDYDLLHRHEVDIIPGAVQISPTEAGDILWNCESIRFSQLRGLLQDSMLEPIEPIIVFDPEPNASYDLSAKVLNEITKVGATKLRFERLERYRQFESANAPRSSATINSLSLLSVQAMPKEMPEGFRPRAIDEIDCDLSQD